MNFPPVRPPLLHSLILLLAVSLCVTSTVPASPAEIPPKYFFRNAAAGAQRNPAGAHIGMRIYDVAKDSYGLVFLDVATEAPSPARAATPTTTAYRRFDSPVAPRFFAFWRRQVIYEHPSILFAGWLKHRARHS